MTDYNVFEGLSELIGQIHTLVSANKALKAEIKDYEDNNPYKNGKIYKITNSVDDKVYVGSTYQELWERHREHRKDCAKKSWPLYIHMCKLGKEKFDMTLITLAPCKSRWQLDQLEYKEQMKVPVANRLFIPKRRVKQNISTAAKWKIYNQRYRDKQANLPATDSDEDNAEASVPEAPQQGTVAHQASD